MDPLAPDHWAEVDALFDQALDRPPDERTAFLRAACGHDPALYHAVAGLLDADARADGAFSESATAFADHLLREVAKEADGPEGLAPGTRLGPYRIEGELGRGGMGVVYRAARADGAFDKTVALKLVKRGMDTDEVLRRFRYERQLLAGLDHPGIARLLDAGASEDGRPFLVMELVEGEPITHYARENSLSVDARMVLFEQVCAAVAYAHRHLVVHRDLKPSNVLVTEGGAVKLLDFGIARLLEDDRMEAPQTRPEQRILTPEYAAPEQAAGEAVTTATDVYALGVLLFELLAHRRPERAGERPSEAAPQDARALRGDVDTLVAKTLRTEPSERYASAAALLDDLRRRREGLPLEARPESAAYRARKFVGRHRWGVGAAAVAALALVAFALVVTVQQQQTARERDTAQATAAFLQDLFDAADPFTAGSDRPDTLRARDLLDRGVQRARITLADRPVVRAQMLHTIGTVYGALSFYDEADTLLAEAAALRGTHLGPRHAEVVASLRERGRVLTTQGRFEESEALLRDALALERSISGERAPAVAETLVLLAEALRRQGRFDDAESMLHDALAINLGAPDELARTNALIELGRVYQVRGAPAEAEPYYREIVDLHRRFLPPGHPRLAESLTMLGDVLREQRRLDEAEPLLREALAIREETLGDYHLQTASAKHTLAIFLSTAGRYEEALALYREVGAINQATLDADHPYIGLNLQTIGVTYARMENYEEALRHYEEAYAFFQQTQPETHPYAIEALVAVGAAHLKLGQLDRSEMLLRQAVQLQEETLGAESWRTGMTWSALGECLTKQGRYAEAERLLLASYETVREANGPVVPVLRRLVAHYEATRQPDAAARYQALLESD